MNYIMLIVIFIFGFLFGLGAAYVLLTATIDGKLFVVRDDQGEGPYLFLELEESARKLEHKKTASFVVEKRMR